MTLARRHPNIIANDIINRINKALLLTRDHPSPSLEQHYLWVELAVLSQFLLNLSFNNSLNGEDVDLVRCTFMYLWCIFSESL